MATQAAFPPNWQIAQEYDPNEHKMQLKGKDYLDVQNRLIWFIRDQRNLIVAGLAKTSYVVQTEMVEHDKDAKWANFKTYVRDVLGNESTMYGSEGAKDFGDYLEKASTKSLGRALVMLGYGTQFAPEIGDEGEADRPVDSPVKRTSPQPAKPASVKPAPKQNAMPHADTKITFKVDEAAPDRPATEIQLNRIANACAHLGYAVPQVSDFDHAAALLAAYEQEARDRKAKEIAAEKVERLRQNSLEHLPVMGKH